MNSFSNIYQGAQYSHPGTSYYNPSSFACQPNANGQIAGTITEPWIDSWLMNIGKINPSVQVPSIKSGSIISNARESFKICIEILNKLDIIKEDLLTNVENLSSAEWKQKTVKIGELKENYTKLMNGINNPEYMTALQKAVHQRKIKRLKGRKRNLARQENRKKEMDERRNIDKQIDRWLEVKKEEDNKVKMEETMNKDIDCVLAEVNKKKLDAKKNLSLIRALIKLRNIRETMYAQRGEKTSLEDKQAFATTTEKMLKIWENALKQYHTEEHMLKTMLQKSASDNLKHKELLKEKETLSNWEKLMFGEKTVSSPHNVALWGLTVAERDMESFIAIRRSWDTFLVPPSQGSSLPIGWVIPPDQCTKDWEKFLRH